MRDKLFLIIDEKTQHLEQLQQCLKKIGVQHIRTAVGADNGWVLLKKKKVDCVISAYEMEEMTGIGLLKIVRKEESLAEIPFFLVDAAFTKMKVIKAGQTGVSGLIVIPYEEDTIKEKLEKVISRKADPVIKKVTTSFNEGLQLIEKKEYGKALEVFTQLTGQKENPEYYFNIGYIKTSQGKHGEAIEAFSMATRLDKLFAKAYEEMGRVYKLMGDHEKAEKYMQQAAEIYMDTNKIGAAEELLNELLESGTESMNFFNTLGVLLRKKGDPEEALTQYKKALKVHPDEPYIHYNIGRLYLDIKKMDKAKSAFEAAIEKDPGFEEAKQVIKAIDLGII